MATPPSASTFRQDLNTGHKAEAFVAMRLAQKCGGMVIPGPPGKFTGHDFTILRQEQRTYECKADLASLETGRCFFEFSCSGQPSGIAATKADWFCHIVPGRRVFIFRPKPMLDWLVFTKSKTAFGGDGGRACGYLCTIGDLEKLAETAPDWCYALELE